tara:strand:+ start:191 stop:370 length:180 start_codon:yes stop_codon:yes gene_type:complete
MAKNKYFTKLSKLSYRQLKQLTIAFEVLLKAGPNWRITFHMLNAVREVKKELEKRLKNC